MRDLLQFIITRKTTHYVSKITLGAARYCTINETAHSTFTKGKVDIGRDKVADLAFSASKERKMTDNVSETYSIGKMDKDNGVKGGDEGVVDYQLESIDSLITKDEVLKKSLTTALKIYIRIRNGCSYMDWIDSHLLDGWPTYSGTEETDGTKISDAITEMATLGWKPNRKRISSGLPHVNLLLRFVCDLEFDKQ